MQTINALTVRNRFGEVLDMLDSQGPVVIEKRNKVRAVLISYDDFRTRFIDIIAEDAKHRFIKKVRDHAAPSEVGEDPTKTLRLLRGYAD